MELRDAVGALGALAHESRLEIFRILARVAPDGIPAGDLAARLGIPAPTLSFHLRSLTAAGWVRSERVGRSLLYSLCRERMRELLWFFGEDCCQGRFELCCDPAERIDGNLERATDEQADKPHVLFVCSRNSARSQMAEAILRQEAGERFAIFSAGMQPGTLHPETMAVLEEIDADTSRLFAKDVGSLLGKHAFHTAIVLCDAAYEMCPRMRPFAPEVLYWPFPDPVTPNDEPDRKRFRDVRDAIRAAIRSWDTVST